MDPIQRKTSTERGLLGSSLIVIVYSCPGLGTDAPANQVITTPHAVMAFVP